jgi:hypothetical protein
MVDDDDDDILPNEILAHIISFCSQSSRVKLSQCNREMRRLIWFSGLWNDEITIYDTTDFSRTLIKYRQTFSKIQKMSFGPNCSGLRPAILQTITRMMPCLKCIHLDKVKDKLFLFGFHITSHRTLPFFNTDENYNFKDIRKFLERLQELRVALRNYSLGLYILLDRYKNYCPTLRIQTVVSDGIHDTTPLEQHSIMRFMVS